MKIGLTYDLRDDYVAMGFDSESVAEFDSPRTIEGIEDALRELGFETNRIGHIRSLVGRLAAGERWDMVFNIAEGVGGFGREAQIPALLEAYGIPYTFSDPLVLSLTLHKGMTKRVVRDLGLPTPDFAVVESEADLASVDLPYPLFAKPVAEGTGLGISPASRVNSRAELPGVCRGLLAKHRQPVLLETYLPGREFTVTVTGTGAEAEVLGVMEITLLEKAEPGVYSYLNKEFCDDRVTYSLADDETGREAARVALAAWRGLGCRDAGRLDLRCNESGQPSFLEVNPLAGLHPEHSDVPITCALAGVGYTELIGRIMKSACKRHGLSCPADRRAAA